MLTYEEYKDIKKQQDDIVDNLSALLSEYPRNSIGLVEDGCKDYRYRLIKSRYNAEFKKLRNINALGYKLFKKQIIKDYELKCKGNRAE